MEDPYERAGSSKIQNSILLTKEEIAAMKKRLTKEINDIKKAKKEVREKEKRSKKKYKRARKELSRERKANLRKFKAEAHQISNSRDLEKKQYQSRLRDLATREKELEDRLETLPDDPLVENAS